MSESGINSELRRLPVRSHEAWRGGVLRLPTWVAEPGREPFRPRVGAFMSLFEDRFAATEPAGLSGDAPPLAIEAFLRLVRDPEAGGYLPGRVELADAEQVRRFVELLANCGVEVREVPDLSPVDELLLESLGWDESADRRPAALSGAGVTVAGLGRFAAAASLMCDAEPWRLFTDQMLLELRFDGALAATIDDLAQVVVMGAAGIDRGLFFFPSIAAFDAIRAAEGRGAEMAQSADCWFVSFVEAPLLPTGDADAWEDFALSRALDGSCPLALRVGEGGTIERPDASRLAAMEVVMRALASAEGASIARGDLTAEAETTAGSLRVRIGLPVGALLS